MQEVKQPRFFELLEKRISSVIAKKHLGNEPNPDELRALRETIRSVIDGVFDKSTQELSDKARSWLGDQFFKRVPVGTDQLVNDIVVINEYALNELTLGDLELLYKLLDITSLGSALKSELEARKKALS